MARRICAWCAKAALVGQKFCMRCGMQYAQMRKRNYGREHQARRRHLLTTSPEVCWLCGEGPREGDPWQADHVVPVSKGGSGGPLRRAHRSCNSRRKDKDASH